MTIHFPPLSPLMSDPNMTDCPSWSNTASCEAACNWSGVGGRWGRNPSFATWDMFLRCLLACTGSDRSTWLIEVISRRVVNGRKEKVERWFDYLFDFILTPAHPQSLQTPPTDYENDSNTREVPRHHPLSLLHCLDSATFFFSPGIRFFRSGQQLS